MNHMPGKKDKSKAITSFVLGLLFWVPLFNLFLGIVGLIFGILSLMEIKKNPEEYGGQWMAITGIVLCCIPIIGGIFVLAQLIWPNIL